MNVSLRYHRISDARIFLEILKNPNFEFFHVAVETLEDEIKYLRGSAKRARDNFQHSYSIIYMGKLVGGCGIKIDQHRKHIGELGYFIDEAFWNKGIASRAVKLLERIGFDQLKLHRIEIFMDPKNKASERVAMKAGYKKEGLLRKKMHCSRHLREWRDSYLYAKVK